MLPNESEIGHFAGFQLQLELIGNQRDEFGIRGFFFGICVGNNNTNTEKPATARFNEKRPYHYVLTDVI